MGKLRGTVNNENPVKLESIEDFVRALGGLKECGKCGAEVTHKLTETKKKAKIVSTHKCSYMGGNVRVTRTIKKLSASSQLK